MFARDLLNGKKVLITGGGTGLGAAMGQRFAELGADLVICGRRKDVLDAKAAEIAQATGRTVTPVVCDIRDPDAVEGLMAAAFEDRPIDVLINNAGALFTAQSERLSHRAVDAVLATNLHGALYCTLAAGRRWIDGKHKGVVLSILSTSTRTGRAFTLPTTVSKTGVLAMTRSLAVEWASRGIRVLAVAPGSFMTEGFLARVRERGGDLDAEVENSLERAGHPEELANLASYLISDGARHINGEMIAIDGGRHLRNSGVEDLLDRTDADWAALREKRRS